MDRKHIPVLLVGLLGALVILLIIGFYSDLLGVRVLKREIYRTKVSQGETLTLQLTPKPQARKVELCLYQAGSVNGFLACFPLVQSMPANAKTAQITIPESFPVGIAVVISRFRDANGQLLPLDSRTEKVAILVKKALFTPNPSQRPNSEQRRGHSLLPGLDGSRAETLFVCTKPDVNVGRFPTSMMMHAYWAPNIGDGVAVRPVGTETWTYYKTWYDNFPEKGYRAVNAFSIAFNQPLVLEANKEYELQILWPQGALSHIYRFNVGSTTSRIERTAICDFRKIELQRGS